MAHALQRHAQNMEGLGVFTVGLGRFQRPLRRLDDIALAPGLDAALQRDIRPVTGLFPGHFVNKSFQSVDGLQPGVHPGKGVHRRLGQGLGHVGIRLEKSHPIKPAYR